MPTLTAGLLTLTAFLPPALAGPETKHQNSYINWKTFKATGVNLGGWLQQEAVIAPTFWTQNCANTTDEWTRCSRLGSRCGSVLERRYATFITPADIDKLASSGVNVLRIPTTYAA